MHSSRSNQKKCSPDQCPLLGAAETVYRASERRCMVWRDQSNVYTTMSAQRRKKASLRVPAMHMRLLLPVPEHQQTNATAGLDGSSSVTIRYPLSVATQAHRLIAPSTTFQRSLFLDAIGNSSHNDFCTRLTDAAICMSFIVSRNAWPWLYPGRSHVGGCFA